MENRKPMIPVSEKCKHEPVHVAGKLIYRTFIKIPDPGFTNIYKPKHNLDSVTNPVTNPVADLVTDLVTIKHNPIVTTRAKTAYPVLGTMFSQVESEASEAKKQLATDQITALGLKHITIIRILVEYKFSSNVNQIAMYIIGKHVFDSLNADQQGLLCNKVKQLLSENGLDYSCKVQVQVQDVKIGLDVLPVSESINNKVAVADFKSAILASADKTVWVSLDSIAQALGIGAMSDPRAYKLAVNKCLQDYDLLIIDEGVISNNVRSVRVTEISDNQSSIVTIKNIKDALIAAGSKKALWFSYDSIAQGLGIHIESLTNIEADKIVKKYLHRNEVYIVYMGRTQTGDRTIRLGFTKPIKVKRN